MSDETLESPAGLSLDSIFQRINEHEQKNELDAAEQVLSNHFGAHPAHPHAIHLSGVLAYRRGRLDEARQRMEQSLLSAPKSALYLRNLCEVYRLLGRNDDALAVGQRAIAADPKDVVALSNLSTLHYDRGETRESLACADAALTIAPNLAGAHFERAKALLADGRLIEGWEAYEWRFRLPGVTPPIPPESDKPQWDGRPLGDAPLLLVADQGFGDVIQFSRYIPWVTERCRDVVIACGPELAGVLRQFPGVRAVVTRWEDVGPFACYCPLSGLPRLHGTRVDNVPARSPYLRADPEAVARWRVRLDVLVPRGYRRVAIAWAGRTTHKNDYTRSVQLSGFAPLAASGQVALISLQRERATSQIGDYFDNAPLLNLGPSLNDFADTMALLEVVDLVICVDTALGHLAGALGRPTWLLLAHATDWRWMLKRTDTPWYPKHRLFRQPAPGAWGQVFDEIASELRRMPAS